MKSRELDNTSSHTGRLPGYLAREISLKELATSASGSPAETGEPSSAGKQALSTGEELQTTDETKAVSGAPVQNQPNEKFYRKAQVKVRRFKANIEE